MDRRIAEVSAPGGQLPALYERRDVEPGATSFSRRVGTVRSSDTVPNLLGVAYSGDSGKVIIDRDFVAEITNQWTALGTVQTEVATHTADAYVQLFQLNGAYLYLKYLIATDDVQFEAWSSAGAFLAASPAFAAGQALRFMLKRTAAGSVVINGWVVPATGAAVIGSDTSLAYTFSSTLRYLSFFGDTFTSLTEIYTGATLTNFLLYDADVFSTATYDTFASDLTPATAIASPGVAALLMQAGFFGGGEAFSYQNDGGEYVSGYLSPSPPSAYAPDGGDPTDIHMGGKGVIEVPFYLDFDEYFWTSTSASARLEWSFQTIFTLPAEPGLLTIFEFQDLVRLRVVFSGTYHLQAEFNNSTVTVASGVALASVGTYTVFVARDADNVYLNVNGAEVTAAATNPIIYNYDKTLGFIIGDGADIENQEPFGGKLTRFALHNTSLRSLQSKSTAVIYYDVDSVYGDEILDLGPRGLTAFAGIRSTSQTPYYQEGGFPGGSFVAATGGYLLAAGTPDITYTGTLKRPLLKDAVVQRQGQRSFLASNGEAYVLDDIFKTYRPLGIPRPTTKVSCSPQGVGAIDGFVRYGYRFVSSDGTVGPVFQLDPCDATGGVNVMLGAETFGLPDETAFGVSYGEAQIGTVALDGVETFILHDQDSFNLPLLHTEQKDPGLTLEVAFRLPSLAAKTEESVISQGVYMPFGSTTWCADNFPQHFPWIGAQGQESSFQFTFRYHDGADYQVLFGVGARDQHYTTGWLSSSDHWHLNHLVVSIQPPLDAVGNTHSLVVCRDDPDGSAHRDDDLTQWDSADMTTAFLLVGEVRSTVRLPEPIYE